MGMTEEIRQCCCLLGLEPGASPKAARQAYRRLMKTWHPDRYADDAMTHKLATEKTKAIDEAYHQLSAFLSGAYPQPRSRAGLSAGDEARTRAAKEAKAQEEAAGRTRRAAEARAREEAIRRAAQARAREQARLREEAHRRAEGQARQAQARLSALLYDDVVMALTGHETRTNRISLMGTIGRTFGFLRGWHSRSLGHAARG